MSLCWRFVTVSWPNEVYCWQLLQPVITLLFQRLLVPRFEVAFPWMRIIVSFLHSTTSFSLFSQRRLPHVPNVRIPPCSGPQEAGVTAPSSCFSWLGRRAGMCLWGELNNRLNSSFIFFKFCSSPVRRHTGFYFSVVPWQHVSGVAKYHGRLPICNANEVFEYVLLQSFFSFFLFFSC